jgi:hypothetical protein
VDQQVGLRLLGGAEGQFLVRAVQRVAGLEGDDLAPAELAEIGAQLVRRVAAGAEIVMRRRLDAGDRPAEIDLARRVVQVVDRRMRVVVGAEDLLGLARLVRRPLVGDVMVARITPSWSRSAMSWPISRLSANSSDTSSVIGIGQSVPSASACSRRRRRNRPRSGSP